MAKQYLNTDLASLLVGMTKSQLQCEGLHITGLTLDSRVVEAGYMFIALAKNSAQRLTHIQQALKADCAAILFDNAVELTSEEATLLADKDIQVIAVSRLADKTSEIAGRFYGDPSLALKVIAITGTNGKTSVSQFIAQSLEKMGHACGVVGTLGVGRVDQLVDTGMTTPDPVTIQAMLAEFCQQSIPYVVIEASSHALEQGRLSNIAIDVAILTNLSRDHLDYHQNLESYASAKKRLFEFDSLSAAVINSSDDFGKTIIDVLAKRRDVDVLTYSSEEKAMLTASAITTNHSGLDFTVRHATAEKIIHSALLGRFNVDNLLAAMTTLLAVGFTFDEVADLVAQCQSVKGRMEAYGGDKQAQVVIDFAHTPDALSQALSSLREHVATQGQLWCVFGCGGDRDTGKRSLMGEAVERYADHIILTSDNPRSEENTAIVTAILQGIKHSDTVYIEHDRAKAIGYAVHQANAQDIVLVAGKGHEAYQEIAGIKYPFSDEQAVLSALSNDTSAGQIQ